MIEDKSKIEFVVSNFQGLENQLLECLNYIPFIEKNKDTISPKFIPIILESCSLIESIFKISVEEANMNFKKYSKKIDDLLQLSETISIFLVTPIQFIMPYRNWTNQIPSWWDTYNKLKHNRINNYDLATYVTVINSLVALHQLISKNRLFTNHIIEKGWINPDSETIPELIGARIGEYGVPINLIACESQLIISPLHSNIVNFEKGDYKIENCNLSNKTLLKITINEFNL